MILPLWMWVLLQCIIRVLGTPFGNFFFYRVISQQYWLEMYWNVMKCTGKYWNVMKWNESHEMKVMKWNEMKVMKCTGKISQGLP